MAEATFVLSCEKATEGRSAGEVIVIEAILWGAFPERNGLGPRVGSVGKILLRRVPE